MNALKKAGVAIAIPALTTAALALASPGSANPGYCSGGGSWGGFGARCSSAPYPDGSYDQCDQVNVLGWGGTNCYRVYPPR